MDLRSVLQGLVNELLPGQQMSEEHFEEIYQIIEDKVDNEPPPRFAFIGETGVGKYIIMSEFLMKINPEKFVYANLNFSAQTSS